MSNTRRRLDKLEVSLTPRQAVILWMEQTHRFRSIYEYVMSLKGAPDTAFPLYVLPDQVEKAIERQMKGRPKQEVARAVRAAVRDTVFLFHLHHQANGKVLSDQDANLYRSRWLRSELSRLLAEHTERSARRSKRSRESAERWKGGVQAFLLDLYALREAVALVSKRYFYGRQLLFPGSAELLEALVNGVERMAEMYEDAMAASGRKSRGIIDMEGLRRVAEGPARVMYEYFVAMARAEALEFMGDHRSAVELVNRCMFTGGYM